MGIMTFADRRRHDVRLRRPVPPARRIAPRGSRITAATAARGRARRCGGGAAAGVAVAAAPRRPRRRRPGGRRPDRHHRRSQNPAANAGGGRTPAAAGGTDAAVRRRSGRIPVRIVIVRNLTTRATNDDRRSQRLRMEQGRIVARVLGVVRQARERRRVQRARGRRFGRPAASRRTATIVSSRSTTPGTRLRS